MAGGTYLVECDPDADVVYHGWIAYAWLTGRSRGKEINLMDLTKAERKEFDASMAKEWENWRNFRAVTAISGDQAKELLKSTTAEVVILQEHHLRGEASRWRGLAPA